MYVVQELYNKKYTSQDEEQFRFTTFVRNSKKIEKLSVEASPTYTLGKYLQLFVCSINPL